jgi:pimeloyl-ACP methyl ester carboxylesterase
MEIWVWIIIILCIMAIFLMIYMVNEMLGRKVRKIPRYAPTPLNTPEFSRENVIISLSDGTQLAGYRYVPKLMPLNGVTIIVLHGFNSSALSPNDIKLANSLAKLGYCVFSYDIRDHGNSTSQKYRHHTPIYYQKAMLDDPKEVLAFIKTQPNVDKTKLAVIGFSYGGAIALSGMLYDPDVSFICAGCAVFDFNTLWLNHRKNSPRSNWWPIHQVFFHNQNFNHFQAVFDQVSPKFHAQHYRTTKISSTPKDLYLIYARDDPLVLFSLNFHQIKEAFQIEDAHTLIFEKGGHSFMGHHDEILTQLETWLKNAFF